MFLPRERGGVKPYECDLRLPEIPSHCHTSMLWLSYKLIEDMATNAEA
jgi:hypothetical protein